jgi:ADP-ribosylglycohydrolase
MCRSMDTVFNVVAMKKKNMHSIDHFISCPWRILYREIKLKKHIFTLLSLFSIGSLCCLAAQPTPKGPYDIPVTVIQDKVKGGLLGEILGDLNGLKYEMKYIDEPGNVETYVPELLEGAWTDDDTDIEWIYILEMQRTREMMLSPQRITELWKRHINRNIWCSHQYLRQLMDIGIQPPLTGKISINPWADFNLSGQFVSETWGLISPGMPRTAARLGLHYTHVSIEGEPSQSTQMFATMISIAYLTSDIYKILDAGEAALDPKSEFLQIMRDVRRWHDENPGDWRANRKLIKEKYTRYDGRDMRARNGVILNGAATIAALLYGNGDFVETVRHAFNFGWDCDNNAAMSGAILGVIKGQQWLMSQRWNIRDRFRNTSRDDMPTNETITGFGDRMLALTDQVIIENGGNKITVAGEPVYRLKIEQPANIERLPDLKNEQEVLRKHWKEEIEQSIVKAEADSLARAAYLAICLNLAPDLRHNRPEQWVKALTSLQSQAKVMQALFYESPIPAGEALRAKAIAAGLVEPAEKIRLWMEN